MKIRLPGVNDPTESVRPLRYFELYGERFVVHRTLPKESILHGKYAVTHYTTGLRITSGVYSIAEAIRKATTKLEEKGEAATKEAINKAKKINA